MFECYNLYNHFIINVFCNLTVTVCHHIMTAHSEVVTVNGKQKINEWKWRKGRN
jgi:hypothetical protein